MFKGVQWKIVFIYSLLIIFAMQFFAVFLSQSLERYYLNTYSSNLESQGLLLSNFLERHLVAGDEGPAIDSLVREYSRYAGTTEIMVLDAFGRVLSSSRSGEDLRGQRIVQDETIRALTGSKSEDVRIDPETRERAKYLALPVRSGDKTLGVVYLVGSLEPIYQTLREIQLIFLTGALLVIGVTVLLGFVLAKTITIPIQEVTAKAEKIAKGDFKQRIIVRSQDEIGSLGEMFNYLSCQLEETLREISSEKGKGEAILKNMTDGIVAVNKEGELLHINPAARRLLDLPENSVAENENLSSLMGHDDWPKIMESGQQISKEIVLDQRKTIILAHYVPFLTPAVSVETPFNGVLIVLQDITKERELVRIQQEFVANVSHELRTPLTTVKSYTEALLSGAIHQPQLNISFLNTIEKETDRMVRLVKDLLVLSQLDYKQINWHREQQSLDMLISEVMGELKVKFSEKLRHIELSLPAEPVMAWFDRDKLKQVLLNIINNAYKYTQQNGTIEIILTVEQNNICIVVRDNGIGIPKEELGKVFERFYRVDKTRSRDFGGTGLGLSIAREIVEAHDGTIFISSKLDRGTEVTVLLPRYIDGMVERGNHQCESA
jgi:two-component system, OmpR family, sensor histidine kinase VicK